MLFLAAGCSENVSTETFDPSLPDLSGLKIAMVVAPDQFQEAEFITSRDILAGAKAEVIVTSLAEGVCQGMTGTTVDATAALQAIKPDEFDGIVFIGGPGATVFWEDETAHLLLTEFNQENKLVAAICLAPVTLARAGILNGVPATGWESEKASLEMFGARYTGRNVERFGNIVTGSGPEAAEVFALELVDVLNRYNDKTQPEKNGSVP